MMSSLRTLILGLLCVYVGSCPADFENHGERCYKVVTLKVSWIDAKMYCRVFGADLAIIDDNQEEDVINGIIKRIHGSVSLNNYWLDGTDILSENEWRWMGENGRSSVISGYKNWHIGQPDSSGNCMHIVYYNATTIMWNDEPCTSLQNFICETSNTSQGNIFG